MKTHKLNISLFAFLFLTMNALSVHLIAQVTNANYNYQVRWETLTVRTDDQSCTGGANEDQNDRHDPPAACAAGDEWRFEIIVEDEQSGSYTAHHSRYHINSTNDHVAIGTTFPAQMDMDIDAIDLITRSWENDDGIWTGWDPSVDDHYGWDDHTYNFTTHGEVGQSTTFDFFHTNTTNEVELSVVYRFTNGENFANALTFGTINTGDVKIHRNSARTKPSWANSGLGYVDNYNSSDNANFFSYPDVCYKFSINTCQLINVGFHTTSSFMRFHLVEMGSSNSYTYITTGSPSQSFEDYLEPGEYGIIVEPGTSETGIFRLRVESLGIPTISPGTVELNGPSTIPSGTDHPGSIVSTASATNHQSYNWERRLVGSGSWDGSIGVTTASFDLPVLNHSYEYRRCALDGCGGKECTDEILVEVLPSNGVVSGKVLTPGNQPVSDITVTITNLEYVEGLGGPGSFEKSAVTNASGNYSISNFYYGPDITDWKVIPSYDDHVFSPDSTIIQLSPNAPNVSGIDFTDYTAFSFQGTVYHDFDGQQCGFAGAGIYVNNVLTTTTDSLGNYSVSIPSIANYTITAKYEDTHQFSPASITMYIDEDKIDQNFENLTYDTLNLSLLAGCEQYAGITEIQIFDSLQCINKTYTTSAGSGLLTAVLPAKKYRINVTNFVPSTTNSLFEPSSVTTYFDTMDIGVDLRLTDTSLHLVYHPVPTFHVAGIPDPPDCGFPYPIMEQYTTNLLQFTVYDYAQDVLYSGHPGCLLDTGSVRITDFLTTVDENARDTTLPISGGLAYYRMRPMAASLVPPHTKDVTFLTSNLFGGEKIETEEIFIHGTRPRTGTFTTVSPQIPLFVLHDPPGDLSYSELIQNTTVENSFSISSSFGGYVGAWAKAQTQLEVEVFKIKQWGEILGHFEVGTDHTSTTDQVSIMSVTTSYGTSAEENPETIYGDGDAYIGAAFNILYAVNDVVQFDPNRCEVRLDKKLMISPDTFSTTYIWSHAYIRDQLIPTLRNSLANGVVDPDSIKFFEDQAAIWEQIIYENEERKRAATYTDNYSFNGGTNGITQSYVEEITQGSSYEWTTHINATVAGELGLTVGGVGGSAGFEIQTRWDWGESSSTSITESVETTFVMADNESDDAFSVSVAKDPVYATPMFKLIAAETSCPYEEGTLPRYDAALEVDQAIHYNVDPNGNVLLKFTVFNQSQSEDDLKYVMGFNVESNPDGALINGSANPPLWSFTNPIPYGGSIQQTVTIEKGPGNVFAYENLEFVVYPDCIDDGPIASKKVSIYFDTPCTDITIESPENNWVVSNATSNVLPVHLTDYVKSSMNGLSIQYTPLGSSAWSQALNIPISSLHTNPSVGSTYTWNTTYIPDGEYAIRAKVVCASDILYTPRVVGMIDQTPPQLYGRPSPVDHAYTSVGEEIKLKFTEELDCSAIEEYISLSNVLTGLQVDIEVVCNEDEIVIQPSVDLLNLAPSMYELVAFNVKDIYGNVQSDSVIWQFSVGDYHEYTCNESTIFYVDKSATSGYRDGSSWSDAFVDLSQALKRACPNSTIYVAEGTYHPWDSIGIVNAQGDTIADPNTISTVNWTFIHTHNYDIYGGFPQGGGSFDDRNPSLFKTILSGDKNHNGIPDAGDSRTIYLVKDGVEARIDGVIIENGFAEANGIAIASRAGAGLINQGGNIEVHHTVFRNLQTANLGSRTRTGGAFLSTNNAQTTFINCLFHDNKSSEYGGAITAWVGTSIQMYNCTVTGNEAETGGGAFHLNSGTLELYNTIISNNSAPTSPDIYLEGSSTLYAENSMFDDVYPTGLTGLNNFESTVPQFVDPVNHNFELTFGSAAIDAGKNAHLPLSVTKDLGGKYRFMDAQYSSFPKIDIGAMEFSPCGASSSLTRVYVDANASGGLDGTSWADAFDDLNHAFASARNCGIDTILVAAGSYSPDTVGYTNPGKAGFYLWSDLVLLGGFPSGGSAMENRDPFSNISELTNPISGAINHLIIADNVRDRVVLDGFHIVGNNSGSSTIGWSNSGAALFIHGSGVNQMSSPIIRNCTFKNNGAENGGAVALVAVENGVVQPRIINCRFENNSSAYGGAIYHFASGGGALILSKLTNCVFRNNSAGYGGGAVYSTADTAGQAISNVINCTFFENGVSSGEGAVSSGSEMNNGHVAQYFTNSILWENHEQGSTNEQLHAGNDIHVSVRYSIVQDADAGNELMLPNNVVDGGNNTDDMPLFTDAINGNLSLKYGSVGLNDGLLGVNLINHDVRGKNRIHGPGIDRGAYEFDYIFPCGQFLTLIIDDEPVPAGLYKAGGPITSQGEVRFDSYGDVIFNSTESIELQSGFFVESGVEFEAVIENPCTDN